MTQGFNFNFNPISEFGADVLDKLQFKSPGTGFRLGASGPLRPTAMSQRFMPTVYQQPSIPSQSIIPGRNTIALPTQQKPLLLTTSGKPLPNQSSVINLGGDAGQMAYKLPNGTYTSNRELANIASKQMTKAKLLRGAKAGGITSAISIPGAIIAHKDAYKYYDDMTKDKSLPGEWRQIANALRLKEAMAMGIEGPGTAIGTGLGAMLGKGNKWAMLAGGAIPEALGRPAGAMADYLLQPAIDKYNFPVYNGGIKLGSFNFGGGSKGDNKNGNMESGTKPSGSNGGKGSGVGSAISQQLASQLSQPQGQPQGESNNTEQQANSQAVIDYINKLQEINRPYIDSLQNYLNNYDKLARENYARNRYWQGIASITGNPAWSKMAGYYNPVVNEATRVGLVKQLQDAQAGDLNAINEVMGDMAIAKELELPPETAFANKNLLTALSANRRRLTDWDKAQLYDATRRYGFDSALNRALAVQNLRNQGALERALINASIYGGGFPGVAPGLNAVGGVNTQKEIKMQQALNGN